MDNFQKELINAINQINETLKMIREDIDLIKDVQTQDMYFYTHKERKSKGLRGWD